MIPFKRTRCFASILLIVIVLFHILICVDAGWSFKSFGGGRRPVVRPMGRPIVRRPIVRPPVIRPAIIRTGPIGPGVPRPVTPPKPSILKGPLVHQPMTQPISRPPVISPSLLRPRTPVANAITNNVPQPSPPKPLPIKPSVPVKTTSSAMVLYKRPLNSQSQGSSIQPGSSNAGSSSSHSPSSATNQQTAWKPTIPLKTPSHMASPNKLPQTSQSRPTAGQVQPSGPLHPTSSAMVLYKRPLTSPSQSSSIQPGSSSAGSSSPHSPSSATHQQTAWKPTVPLKTPLHMATPYKLPQTSQVNLIAGQGTKISRPNQLLITNKPTSPEQSISKITTTNVQSQSKPISTASVSNYPKWANPYLKPQSSGSGNFHSSSSSLPTKPLTSSSSLVPYNLAQNKPSHSAINSQASSSGSSNLHVPSVVKPQINSRPQRPYSITSSTTNGVKPESTGSLTSHGHPHHKPLPQPSSTANQVTTSQHHASPINESPISSSHASSVMSSSNSHLHQQMPSAPITSTSQIHSSYPGANHPTNAAHFTPQQSHPPIQIFNTISNGNPGQNGGYGMGPYGGSGMGGFGGPGMGQYGGSGTGGLGRMVAESAVHSLVHSGVQKILTPSEPTNFNYATVPINPDLYKNPQVPGAAPPAGTGETLPSNNNYFVDPNAANIPTQDEVQPTNGQTLESGFSSGNDASNQNPGTQSGNVNVGNFEPTNVQQPTGQLFDQQNGSLPPLGEENGNWSPALEQNGNLPLFDEENGNGPPSFEENGYLPPLNEDNGNGPPSFEENGNLPPLDGGNGNGQPLFEENGNLPPLDEGNENGSPLFEENENLPPLDEGNGNGQPLFEENGNGSPLFEENGNGSPLFEENGNGSPLFEENGNGSPLFEENENLPPLDEVNRNLPSLDEGNGIGQPLFEENGSLPPLDEGNENFPRLNEGNENEKKLIESVPVDNSELWELTEMIFGYEANISQYINLDLQVSEFDSIAAIEATKPLLNVQPEANLFPTIKAFRNIFDNYEDDPTKTEIIVTEKEDTLLAELLKTNAMIKVMQFLEDKNYIIPNQRMKTLRQLWMQRYQNSMSGFERIFLAEKSSDPVIFGGQNWIYFDNQEKLKRIKYTNYQNSLNLADVAQLLKVNYQFDNVEQKGKAMLVGTSPQLEMALYTVCHYVRGNDWCTVSLADTKFGINTHAWIYEGKEMLDVGFIDF